MIKNNKIEYKLWYHYVAAYTGQFPCYLIHEISHWIISLFTVFLGYNTFPKIVIDQLFTIEEVEDDCTQGSGFYMYVDYGTHYENKFLSILISIAPAITTILLFVFSPWWLNLYWISNLSTLWISLGDYNSIKGELKSINYEQRDIR